jgi:excisionase family DNA binding protein
MEGLLTTKQAAARLGVTAPRVRQMILAGQLPAEKFGRELMIRESDLTLVKNRPAVGRPKKAESERAGKKGGKKSG